MKVQLFQHTKGPVDARVMLVGEAWGAEEERLRKPFVGESGLELDRMLASAGILSSRILFTNVVHARPPQNDFTYFLNPKKHKGGATHNGINISMELKKGIAELEELIAEVKPDLIIGCGNVPMWALTNDGKTATQTGGFVVPAGIINYRGSMLWTRQIDGVSYPFLPIIHPAAILRSWDLRNITVHDLKVRAKKFLDGELIWIAPVQEMLHKPSFMQVKIMLGVWKQKAKTETLELSVDIETLARKYITCIGVADAQKALCIPLFYFDTAGKVVDYFTLSEEQQIIAALVDLLEHPNVKIIGQNFAYDTQYLCALLGWHGWNQPEKLFDTMIAQNVMFPGTPKALHNLASIYCEHYVYWKDESNEWQGNDPETLWLYNCKDIRHTYDIAQAQKQALRQFKLEEQFHWKMRAWRMAMRMSLKGTLQDTEARRRIKSELQIARQRLADYLLKCVPLDIRYTSTGTEWFKSPKGSMDLFYTYLCIEPVLHKKTKKPTTDQYSIEVLKKRAPWLHGLFDSLTLLRSIDVFISHFIDIKLGPDNRIRTNFNVAGTETYRWSSSTNGFGEGTNLQNIPKGDEE